MAAVGGGGGGSGKAMSSARKMAKSFGKSSETVKVVVRVRPLFGPEIADKRKVACMVNEDMCEVALSDPKGGEHDMPRKFTFDACFPATVTQRRVYDRTAAGIVESVMEGFNGTIFAYGQTGAGKTHTMEGAMDPPELRGLMPNAFQHIFECVAANEDEEKQFLVRASYLEIYNEEIRDLLSRDPKNKLELKESVDTGVFVKDLTTAVVKSAAEIDAVLQSGKKNRSTGSTLMNASSSRSHSIFTVTIETSSKGVDGKQHFRVGKLNMVDLAGSERQSKTGATGQRLKEATKINLSLSALGNVISALVDSKSTHTPYRDSKLTRLLQDSLGGNTKTCMIANCGPADYNYDETLSTLRYADRAKQIKNKPRINEDPKDAMLREYQQEIERLRSMLEEKAKMASSAPQVTIDGVAVPASGETTAAREAAQQAHAAAQATGLSDAERKHLEAEAAKRQEELEARAREEKEVLLKDKARTEEERAALAIQLEAQEKAQQEASKAQQQLQHQLQSMQQKLIKGSEMMDLAAKQQEDLRRAQMELQDRKQQEAKLSQELEEANIMMEEQYANMAEEVEAKRAKLKKLFGRWQSAKAEIRDLKEESQREKEDMLATIRELNRVIKLRQVLLDHFVPPQEVEKLETRAQWDDEAEEWMIAGQKITGNALRPRRPNLLPGARRAETQFAAARRRFDPSARWRSEDPVELQAEPALRTAAPYNPSMRERVALLGDSAEASGGTGGVDGHG